MKTQPQATPTISHEEMMTGLFGLERSMLDTLELLSKWNAQDEDFAFQSEERKMRSDFDHLCKFATGFRDI